MHCTPFSIRCRHARDTYKQDSFAALPLQAGGGGGGGEWRLKAISGNRPVPLVYDIQGDVSTAPNIMAPHVHACTRVYSDRRTQLSHRYCIIHETKARLPVWSMTTEKGVQNDIAIGILVIGSRWFKSTPMLAYTPAAWRQRLWHGQCSRGNCTVLLITHTHNPIRDLATLRQRRGSVICGESHRRGSM